MAHFRMKELPAAQQLLMQLRKFRDAKSAEVQSFLAEAEALIAPAIHAPAP
jgi:hypothetical protein